MTKSPGTLLDTYCRPEGRITATRPRIQAMLNQAECRERLGRLIHDENSALSELATLLDREHGYLEANDVVSLEGATRERQRCVARIFRVDEARRALCHDMGRPLDLKGLEDLVRWCDPQGTLAGGWAECSAAADK